MMAEDRAARHHASAATHHRHAMQFHREASRHYQIGKDYAHAAHQALVAHGHTLKAIDHWQQAVNDYAEHGAQLIPESESAVEHRGDSWRGFMGRLLARHSDNAIAVATELSGAEQHAAAAGHAEQAALHHGNASKYCSENDFPMAAHEAQIAHDHAMHSFFHGNEAARQHAEQFGWGSPAAEPAQ
jgi:hypothetical protein